MTSSSPTANAIAEYVSLGVTAPDAVFNALCRIAGQFSLARLTARRCMMSNTASRYFRAGPDIVGDLVGDMGSVDKERTVDVGVVDEDGVADGAIADVADDVAVKGTVGGG